jgi:predicted TIM-barrel fold metal-dependent hydrolase
MAQPAVHFEGLNRRQFVQAAGQAALALGLPCLAAAGEKPMPAGPMPIVDTHQHLWDLSKLRLPWLEGAGPLNRSYVMKDYLEATAGLDVVKAVYMEVDVAADQKLAEAEHLLEICKSGSGPTCAAVIGGLVGTEEFRPYLLRFKGSPHIKGVRHLLFRPETRGGRCLEKLFLDGVRLLGELGMSFDICIAAAELADGAKLLDACPGTRFILDHCGNADVQQFRAARSEEASRRYVEAWRRDIAAIAGRKNVVCKISGIVASAPKDQWKADDLAPIVNHCLDSFGPDRVMFGGDWPVCTRAATFRQWVEALRQIVRERTAEEQRKLFAANAIRFYGLA